MRKANNNVADNEQGVIELSNDDEENEFDEPENMVRKRIYSHWKMLLALYGSFSDFWRDKMEGYWNQISESGQRYTV